MIRQYELVERVQRYKPDVNEALLNKAYIYAMQKHGMQKRASGDPYFSHPLEVATILIDMHLDEATIIVALLHDTIEDTSATRSEIDRLFGSEIGALVEGLTKLKKLDFVSKKAVQAENLRKLLIATSQDVRILLVKLADRLHNMRTLDAMSADKRRHIAEETMDIYAPLAARMGMRDISEELEDLAFRYIRPEAWGAIKDRLAQLLKRNMDLLGTIEQELTMLFANYGITADVRSRQKTAWSIFHKMERKALSFEQLSDIFGFRVIVDKIEDCYRALGIIHTAWPIVPGRFKDYISIPKHNDYRSLHTTIVGPSRQRVELQIRTREMDQIAEHGVAAHAFYKQGDFEWSASGASNEVSAYAWLRQTVQTLLEGDSPEEFLEHTKLELFRDQVFCFTAKGLLIALPSGATPIDFAYAVHTDIGNSCVGAKINGRVVSLTTFLKSGDEVEIIRSPKRQIPPAAWESLVVTGKARLAIRRATRTAIKKQYGGLGRRILERTFAQAGKKFIPDDIKGVLHRLGRKDSEDVFASVGRGELLPLDVIRAVYSDYQDQRVAHKKREKIKEEGWFNIRNVMGMIFKIPRVKKTGNSQDQLVKTMTGGTIGENTLPILGLDKDIEVQFSPDGAVPGDRIVGILQPGAGIVIYPIQSGALAAYDDQPERWIDVRWDIDSGMKERFPARVKIVALNSPASLFEVAQIIANNDAIIYDLVMHRAAPDFTEMTANLAVWDLRHLNKLISLIKEIEFVSNIYRVNA